MGGGRYYDIAIVATAHFTITVWLPDYLLLDAVQASR